MKHLSMSNIMPVAEDAICHYCKKVLFGGRTDRKFCGDTCRNAFNRERRKKQATYSEHPEVDRIIGILKKNHALMLKFNPSQRSDLIIDRQILHEAGFFYNYYTSVKVLKHGEQQYHCFDQYWIDLEYGLVKLSVIEDINY